MDGWGFHWSRCGGGGGGAWRVAAGFVGAALLVDALMPVVHAAAEVLEVALIVTGCVVAVCAVAVTVVVMVRVRHARMVRAQSAVPQIGWQNEKPRWPDRPALGAVPPLAIGAPVPAVAVLDVHDGGKVGA